MAVVGMRPGVGFNPARPQKWAGTRMEPPPSVARPPGEQQAAMAAASPPLEPPGVRSGSQGLLVRPVRKLSGLVAGQHLRRVGLAEHDGAFGAQAGHGGGIARSGG